MSYSQVGTLRLTELRYQVGNGRVGATLYLSFFIWTHKLFNEFLKIYSWFYARVSSWKIVWRIYLLGNDIYHHGLLSSWISPRYRFFSVGWPPLWDGFLTGISQNSSRTSLLSEGKRFFWSLYELLLLFHATLQKNNSSRRGHFPSAQRKSHLISHQLAA